MNEVFRLANFFTIVYFCFLTLWGGNYARKPLASQVSNHEQVTWNTEALSSLADVLVGKLNEEVQHKLSFASLKQTNLVANQLYHQQFDCGLAKLKVKPTTIGYMLNYVGIQGYYNPLSGEAQFNMFIPKFMHPFVVCHEMAHQTGVAAEDDANLMAYLLCANSEQATFRYSGFFNLFLYAYADLKERDSVLAGHVLDKLNVKSKEHLKELREMRVKYRSSFRKYTIKLYDRYLQMQGQKDGIKSYGGVTKWAYIFDKEGIKIDDISICPK